MAFACEKSKTATKKLRMLHDNILVEPVAECSNNSSSIVLPDTAKKKPTRGRVLAVGPGVRDKEGKFITPSVKVGELVLYNQWAGTEIELEGVKRTVMKYTDVIAVEEDN